jgi:GTPase involved in cell partitioning and DNA repair
MTTSDEKKPLDTLTDLVEELRLYDPALLERPLLIFANKYDLDGKAVISFC